MNESRVAIVTGGGSGIGRAIATRLADAGVVVVIFDVQVELAQEAATTIFDRGGRAYVQAVDIASEAEVVAAVDRVVTEIGRPSILCNSAAIQRFGHSDQFDFELWKQVIDVNLSGSFLMCKTLLPYLVETRGSIVNIASLAGKLGIPYDAAYSASKGGVITLTKALAKEYADRDVRINVIAPGAVDTPMLAQQTPQDINPKALQSVPRSPRPPADADDIASVALFLCLQAPASMTGAVVSVDGAAG